MSRAVSALPRSADSLAWAATQSSGHATPRPERAHMPRRSRRCGVSATQAITDITISRCAQVVSVRRVATGASVGVALAVTSALSSRGASCSGLSPTGASHGRSTRTRPTGCCNPARLRIGTKRGSRQSTASIRQAPNSGRLSYPTIAAGRHRSRDRSRRPVLDRRSADPGGAGGVDRLTMIPLVLASSSGAGFWGQVRGFRGRVRGLGGRGAAGRQKGVAPAKTP
jgi:hypothetical protein